MIQFKFQEGRQVLCIDHKMDGIGNVLEKDKDYQVKEFIPSEKCEELFPDNPAEWHKNGGRVEVTKFPGCYWFGRRFQVR